MAMIEAEGAPNVGSQRFWGAERSDVLRGFVHLPLARTAFRGVDAPRTNYGYVQPLEMPPIYHPAADSESIGSSKE